MEGFGEGDGEEGYCGEKREETDERGGGGGVDVAVKCGGVVDG